MHAHVGMVGKGSLPSLRNGKKRKIKKRLTKSKLNGQKKIKKQFLKEGKILNRNAIFGAPCKASESAHKIP